MSDSDSHAYADPYDSLRARRPLLVVLSGPSGVGKDATMERMHAQGVPFYQVVTATTRKKRPMETEGVDYHFLSMQQFATLMEKGQLLEHAMVYGEYKGIPKFEVRKGLDSGLDVVLRVDVQGAATIRRMVPQAVTIFLVAASEEEMVERLHQRRTESPGKLAMRIATARQELRRLTEFKYVVVNSDSCLDDTVRQVVSIMTAERCRVDWEPVQL